MEKRDFRVVTFAKITYKNKLLLKSRKKGKNEEERKKGTDSYRRKKQKIKSQTCSLFFFIQN